jgi:hypothetical protein
MFSREPKATLTRSACMVAILLMAALSPGAGAGDKIPYEDVIKQMLDTMDSLTKTLTAVQNEETAKGAQPELRKTAEKWRLVMKKAGSVPPPSKEERDRLDKEYKTKLVDSQKKLFGEVARVRLVPGGSAALKEISGVLEKKAKE